MSKDNQTTRYFTPSNLNLSSTSPNTLPLLPIDLQTSELIKLTVINILNSSDIDSITEKYVRELTSEKLGLKLDDLAFKILIRQVVEDFLVKDFDGEEEGVEIKPDFCRVICKLSQKRDVAVRNSGGETVVSVREFFVKDGKQLLTPKGDEILVFNVNGISLSSDQWLTFCKHMPEIEEAITKVESKLRTQVEKTQADADKSENPSMDTQKHVTNVTAEAMRKSTAHHKQGSNPEKRVCTENGLKPIEIVRFDGKNYHQWVTYMESYLTHLNVAYVLSIPCPNTVGVEKWIEDDHVCRRNILNSLCDNIFNQYWRKTQSAKDLWEELKLIYLYEEHGSRVSLVKKYIQFEILEEKSVFEQVQELHHIADALIANGMYVEEKFHVNVIISKLPVSWKRFAIELMKDDYLPVWMLMNGVKAEEESCKIGYKNEGVLPRPVFQHSRKLGPQRIPMKRPGANHVVDNEKNVRFCNICKKKGHLPENCWFRNSGSKDTTDEGEKDESAGQSKHK